MGDTNVSALGPSLAGNARRSRSMLLDALLASRRRRLIPIAALSEPESTRNDGPLFICPSGPCKMACTVPWTMGGA